MYATDRGADMVEWIIQLEIANEGNAFFNAFPPHVKKESCMQKTSKSGGKGFSFILSLPATSQISVSFLLISIQEYSGMLSERVQFIVPCNLISNPISSCCTCNL